MPDTLSGTVGTELKEIQSEVQLGLKQKQMTIPFIYP